MLGGPAGPGRNLEKVKSGGGAGLEGVVTPRFNIRTNFSTSVKTPAVIIHFIIHFMDAYLQNSLYN